MITQNNPTPWVILLVLIMVGCVIAGMMLGEVGPFSSRVIEARILAEQTQDGFNMLSTQSVINLTQTQQAPLIQQTMIVAQITTIPLQQTATQVALNDTIQAAQVDATHTALANGIMNSQATQTSAANDLYLQNLSVNATATAISRDQTQAESISTLSFVVVILSVFVMFIWFFVRIAAQAMDARAKEKEAHAQLLAEQRRADSMRINIQEQRKINIHQNFPKIPKSLIKHQGDNKKLPRAE